MMWSRLGTALLIVAATVGGGGGDGAPAGEAMWSSLSSSSEGWAWPVAGARVVAPFVAPPHRYGPGHRGVDLDPLGATAVLASADGVIAFVGAVAGRGIVTIDHGGGLVSTLEPVESTLSAGTVVGRGDPVGSLSTGGHAPPGSLHFGVRLEGEYINPLLLVGDVPRAVLYPCC